MAPSKSKTRKRARQASATTAGEETPASKTTFLDLPAELRNEIYELAIERKTVVLSKSSKSNKKGRARSPALLLASKEIYRETLTIFYSKWTFHFESVAKLLSWLRTLGPQKRAFLRSVIVEDLFTLPQSGPLLGISIADDRAVENEVSAFLRAIERRLSDSGASLKPGCLTLHASCRWRFSSRRQFFSCRRDAEHGTEIVERGLTLPGMSG
ncbi:hypothetical protein PRZ48_014187 [Zasmidium cellare]|uniref:2EXR domain-containing protein n=1 Tax=Zasmidium cellare TaxID=395010 RepID=A0ABR0E0W1_ZASCE|nr:hypothetical protein PRZ48_014187 [Zasmidium cellare]